MIAGRTARHAVLPAVLPAAARGRRGRRCRPCHRSTHTGTGRGASARPWSSGCGPGRAPARRPAAGSPRAPRWTGVAEWIPGPVGSSWTTSGLTAQQHDDRPSHRQRGERFVGRVEQQYRRRPHTDPPSGGVSTLCRESEVPAATRPVAARWLLIFVGFRLRCAIRPPADSPPRIGGNRTAIWSVFAGQSREQRVTTAPGSPIRFNGGDDPRRTRPAIPRRLPCTAPTGRLRAHPGRPTQVVPIRRATTRPPTGPTPPARPQWLAILSIAFAFVFAPWARCSAIFALSQIKQGLQRGRDLALIGLTLSYAFIVLTVAALAVWIVTDRLPGHHGRQFARRHGRRPCSSRNTFCPRHFRRSFRRTARCGRAQGHPAHPGLTETKSSKGESSSSKDAKADPAECATAVAAGLNTVYDQWRHRLRPRRFRRPDHRDAGRRGCGLVPDRHRRQKFVAENAGCGPVRRQDVHPVLVGQPALTWDLGTPVTSGNRVTLHNTPDRAPVCPSTASSAEGQHRHRYQRAGKAARRRTRHHRRPDAGRIPG